MVAVIGVVGVIYNVSNVYFYSNNNNNNNN